MSRYYEIDGKVYRNLPDQVDKNTEDLAALNNTVGTAKELKAQVNSNTEKIADLGTSLATGNITASGTVEAEGKITAGADLEVDGVLQVNSPANITFKEDSTSLEDKLKLYQHNLVITCQKTVSSGEIYYFYFTSSYVNHNGTANNSLTYGQTYTGSGEYYGYMSGTFPESIYHCIRYQFYGGVNYVYARTSSQEQYSNISLNSNISGSDIKCLDTVVAL